MTILHTVQKWWPYLLRNPCYIKTNHQSLKYFLEKRVSSQTQQKWVSKLRGYDYEINYKKAKDNLVVDTLSRTFDAPVSLSAIAIPIPTWLHSVQQGHVNDSSLSEIIQPLASNPSMVPHFSWDGSSLRYKGRLVLPRAHILNMHSFMNSMLLHRQGTLGSWKHMRGHDVTSFGRK